jgi:hypothetical protein
MSAPVTAAGGATVGAALCLIANESRLVLQARDECDGVAARLREEGAEAEVRYTHG